MARSTLLRLQDLRAVDSLIGECRELGDDPILWNGHFSQRLGELVGAAMVIFGEIYSGWEGKGPPAQHAVMWGDDHGFDMQAYVRLFEEYRQQSIFYFPPYEAYLKLFRKEQGLALSAHDLLSDKEWYGSDYYQLYHKASGADDMVFGFREVPREPSMISAMNLVRTPSELDFSAREKAIAKEAHSAVAPLLGGPLTRFKEPSPSTLPLRVRQVLQSVLEGDGDKQIASRLGISKFTVNQYTKVIFRHFGVSSRSELLARWVKRGWGGRFGWNQEAAQVGQLLSTPEGFAI